MTPNVIPELVNVLPPGVAIETIDSVDGLHDRLGKESLNGTVRPLLGTAFIQGNRLQFVTAVPMKTFTDLAKVDRSSKRATADEVAEHSNRPGIPAHQKDIRGYLVDNACKREKFILPGFMLNWGAKHNADDAEANDAKVSLIIYRPTATLGINVWSAILMLPTYVRLHITDGAHRDTVIESIGADKRLPDDERAALFENAVSFTVVFEPDSASAHQDFADAGKARPIAQSLVITYDVRDQKNQRALLLVKNLKFLRTYVDATATNVNLSARSSKVWSMSAMRMLVSQIVDHYFDPDLEAPKDAGAKWQRDQVAKHTDGLEDFLRECIGHIPVLAQLDQSIRAEEPTVTVGELRESLGGDVLLRGIGMAILARAFCFCKDHDIGYDRMAQALGGVDWHVLTVERTSLETAKAESGAAFAAAVVAGARPLWSHMITVSEAGFRIRSTAAAADEAWERIVAEHKLEDLAEAAEDVV
jgi:hypothetical protein